MRNRHQYPSNWQDEIRPNIIKRDGFKCQHCGIRHRQWVAVKRNHSLVKIEADEQKDFRLSGWTVYRILLHVCHIDNNKQNCSESNLKSLCVKCHAKQDASYKAILRKSNKATSQISIFDQIEGQSITF